MFEPHIIFSNILELYPNSYYAEDNEKVIMGINVDYYDSSDTDIDTLEQYLIDQHDEKVPHYVGIFAVLSSQFIHHIEKIPKTKAESYSFPEALFANASTYIYYHKHSQSYEIYGNTAIQIDQLQDEMIYQKRRETNRSAQIVTDLYSEKQHFYSVFDKAKQYIAQGDVFQVVLSEAVCLHTAYDPFSFYLDLAEANPSPYMYYFPTKYGIIVGSSPEVLIKKTNDQLFVAPIAGTRPRGKTAAEDIDYGQNLLNDPKECAEHRMLVDLARNDVGRVSKIGTVRVENMMHIEYFQKVMHIVSDVYGTMNGAYTPFQVVGSVFPAGTLSGAPKIRALEIIDELEQQARIVYGGAIGFFHRNGDIQLAIAIRSAFFEKKDDKYAVHIQAGAGIVYDSIKENEYQEIINKRASVYDLFDIEEEV